MADKIYDWPAALTFSGQVFHVPGAMLDGGITSGGARVRSPEPGGFSRLEIDPALATNERGTPWASWIMSKTNGQILKVRLAITPQIITANADYTGEITYAPRNFAAAALIGGNTIFVNFADLGQIAQPGHVIGHDKFSYMIDEITYDGSNLAQMTVTPPLRKNITTADLVVFRPYFCGTIANGDEIIELYEKPMNGNIDLPKIILDEVIPS